MKVFVDADSDERLARRLHRDISQRGRNLQVCTCASGYRILEVMEAFHYCVYIHLWIDSELPIV